MNLLHRIATGVTLVDNFNSYRSAAQKSDKFPILADRKELNRILGESRERYDLVGKAEEDFYYLIARSLTSTRNDLGQYPIPNGNGDIFIHTELTRTNANYKVPNYKTFIGRGVFTNHQSDKVECCFGTQLDVRLAYAGDFRGVADTSVHNLLAIDKVKAQEIGVWEGIKKGYLTTWSMGCDIEAAMCTICGNTVTNNDPKQCEHVASHKTSEMISSCKNFAWNGKRVKVGDLLIGPSFAELSLVTIPADYTAETQEVLGEIDKSSNERTSSKVFAVSNSEILNSYSTPSYRPVERSRDVENTCDVVPNGDGTYTAILKKEIHAVFGDFQTALDYIQEQKKLINSSKNASQSSQDYKNDILDHQGSDDKKSNSEAKCEDEKEVKKSNLNKLSHSKYGLIDDYSYSSPIMELVKSRL